MFLKDRSLGRCALMYLSFTSAILPSTRYIFYLLMISITGCTRLPSDIDSIHCWCVANPMTLSTDKTIFITFTRKINAINYKYKLCDKFIIRTDSIQDLGVLLDPKLFFHHYVDYIFLSHSNFWDLYVR